ncbi:synaptobrevin-like protein [Encephalitozoon intestinalis ATCC 50506]|uniref:Synaptobrevin-like protein n=1 Tax=Encephalitozoon intestinalis (strain ATCC 50506) TaxID=876142 RepID=E0SAG0_ENCIT|nr:synaptobrevin-like protein [Encephalitozoon intestinalis ATCC 50506]ADM12585.1 synaptobrevin-like protein [Encephalitozoon intestinalis ATCC 50506]UTX46442.1 synaptobrevin-like protein [Encephalitozoon intestinalis]
MAILYTQIIKLPDYRILSGEYSPQSNSLRPGNDIVKELRNTIKSIPGSGTSSFYTFNSLDTRFVFYFKVHTGIVFAVISDRYTSSKLASEYMDLVVEGFAKIYVDNPKTTYYTFDPTIKAMSDRFNRDSNYAQGMAVVEETKGLLAESLNMIIKRDENINNLKGLASRMTVEAQMMQKNIQRMHLKSMLNDYWIYVVFAVLIILFVYYIAH